MFYCNGSILRRRKASLIEVGRLVCLSSGIHYKILLGKDDSVDSSNTTSRAIYFLNEATTLSVEHPELEREIMIDSTYSIVY